MISRRRGWGAEPTKFKCLYHIRLHVSFQTTNKNLTTTTLPCSDVFETTAFIKSQNPYFNQFQEHFNFKNLHLQPSTRLWAYIVINKVYMYHDGKQNYCAIVLLHDYRLFCWINEIYRIRHYHDNNLVRCLCRLFNYILTITMIQ